MADIKGSCRCGKVTYSSAADPVFTGLCHCSSCQKSTGSAFASLIGLPTASLTVTGTTKRFDDIADSGAATHREFCPECGSTLTQSADAMAGLTMVPIGSLDDPHWAKPAMQIFCDSAMPWATVPGLQEFPKMPSPG